MKAVHKLGIIHRNLKHDKILLDESLHVRISGFGSSKLLSLNEQMQTMTHAIGDVLFMAPELVNEDESYNQKVDVYSFAFIAFYIISYGKLPSLKKIALGEMDEILSCSFLNENARNIIEK